jgi:hypothetical protein
MILAAQVFAQHQRSEQALVVSLAQMYGQGGAGA